MHPRLGACVALLIPLAAGAVPLNVFVSVLPQETFVAKVGAEQVRVTSLTRPGQSPENFEPTPQQIAALARADLFIGIGMPFEAAWMGRFRAANPRMKVLDAREGIDLLPMTASSHDHGLDHGYAHDLDQDLAPGRLSEGERAREMIRQAEGPGGQSGGPGDAREAGDPHIWTSPPLVARMTLKIRDALSELDPEHAEAYVHNQAAFSAELASLDAEIRDLLKDLPSRKFLVFHPAWGYFAATYGLTQVAIESGGKEPAARRLGALIEEARRDRIGVVFVQPQSSLRLAQRVADAIDGQVIAIDPLSPDYVENLRQVARRMAVAAKP